MRVTQEVTESGSGYCSALLRTEEGENTMSRVEPVSAILLESNLSPIIPTVIDCSQAPYSEEPILLKHTGEEQGSFAEHMPAHGRAGFIP